MKNNELGRHDNLVSLGDGHDLRNNQKQECVQLCKKTALK